MFKSGTYEQFQHTISAIDTPMFDVLVEFVNVGSVTEVVKLATMGARYEAYMSDNLYKTLGDKRGFIWSG